MTGSKPNAPGGSSAGGAREAIPYVVHALAATGGVAVRPARLSSLAFRVVLHAQAGQVVPLLVEADLASRSPGTLTRDPGQLEPPSKLAEDMRGGFSELIQQIAQLHRLLMTELDQVVAALPVREGLVVSEALPLSEAANDNDRRALFEEAQAMLAAALGSSDPAAVLAPELELWTHAAKEALFHMPEASALALVRGLLGALPGEAASMLRDWGEALTPAQHAALIEQPSN